MGWEDPLEKGRATHSVILAWRSPWTVKSMGSQRVRHDQAIVPPRVYFPVLCKFWQLYDGVNGDLLQEGLCHTQVCGTQSPCPCGSPLLTCTSSELKWAGMGEFNSDDHYIYYCGQESLRRNGVPIIVNKRVQNAVLGCSLKNDRMIPVHFQGKPFSITVIQVYAPTSNAEEAKVEHFYEDLQDLL